MAGKAAPRPKAMPPRASFKTSLRSTMNPSVRRRCAPLLKEKPFLYSIAHNAAPIRSLPSVFGRSIRAARFYD
jgi:hypothetical protein